MERVQKSAIIQDLQKKIVFLVGPRQVGKTWLSKDIAKSFSNAVYLNYDSREDRIIIENESWLETTGLLILDELHKMPRWKNYVKGVFDTKKEHMKILVTGSARLDAFRQSGDSLAGRFFVHRLLPFTLAEIKPSSFRGDLNRLMTRGGFPEPFLAESDTETARWRSQYIDGLIRNDVLDFEKIHDFKAIQLVLDLLRERVGSALSYSSIATDVQVSVNTVKKYIQIFEALYIVFRITPFSKNIARSNLKEPKIYFFDTGMVKGDEGIKFENFVALSLLQYVYHGIDCLGQPMKLHYLRTRDGKEVDFCLVKDNAIEYALECKYADAHVSPSLSYFSKKYKMKGIQLVKSLKHEQKHLLIEVRRAGDFLEDLSVF